MGRPKAQFLGSPVLSSQFKIFCPPRFGAYNVVSQKTVSISSWSSSQLAIWFGKPLKNSVGVYRTLLLFQKGTSQFPLDVPLNRETKVGGRFLLEKVKRAIMFPLFPILSFRLFCIVDYLVKTEGHFLQVRAEFLPFDNPFDVPVTGISFLPSIWGRVPFQSQPHKDTAGFPPRPVFWDTLKATRDSFIWLRFC